MHKSWKRIPRRTPARRLRSRPRVKSAKNVPTKIAAVMTAFSAEDKVVAIWHWRISNSLDATIAKTVSLLDRGGKRSPTPLWESEFHALIAAARQRLALPLSLRVGVVLVRPLYLPRKRRRRFALPAHSKSGPLPNQPRPTSQKTKSTNRGDRP